jgi:hypothetical protein
MTAAAPASARPATGRAGRRARCRRGHANGGDATNAKRPMPPCSPASRSSARNPRHARFAKAKLRMAAGWCALPLTRAARGGLLKGSGRGASRPSLREGVRLAPRAKDKAACVKEIKRPADAVTNRRVHAKLLDPLRDYSTSSIWVITGRRRRIREGG